jgi:CubicO group peptidase (beta-lactamase class C family)
MLLGPPSIRRAVVALALWSWASVALAEAPSPPDGTLVARRLEERLRQLASERAFSGELLVTEAGRPAGGGVFSPLGVKPGALYRIGSITKGFTAAAIFRLAERGRLRLDDPVARYFPELDAERLRKDGVSVTIDHLLTHTSGLARLSLPALWGRGLAPEEITRALSRSRLQSRPGEVYSYSNEGFVVLGR